MKTLVLGLGNDLLSDDSIGVRAVRELATRPFESVDYVETSVCGLSLLDILVGYQRAIVIDAMHTVTYEPGSVIELNPGDFSTVMGPSPHYAGLPELLQLADVMSVEFPREIKVIGVEAGNIFTVGEELSPPVRNAMSSIVEHVQDQLRYWGHAERRHNHETTPAGRNHSS